MEKLTSKEEEILSYFWEKGPLFVRELLQLQPDPKPHYNTLSTIVRTLEEKGYIGHHPFGNTHQYYAKVDRKAYSIKSLQHVISRYFGNSYRSVVSSLIEEENLSPGELEKLIEEIKEKNTKQ
ncbi:MAG: BlaI/MecI/CopY family transcriptional regulator [Tannerellaceae bacterium]|nr:BlaI/MecI/CopY family transcriptional regulator [Tannerellaceae bacterium]MCD8264939.1 BlaI/MecI/CopY family transcriptional regulator [Tannerellaceae bacterium]